MTEKELALLTDEQLLEAAKQQKPSPLIDAFFIGFLVGIIVFSAASNALGLFTLLPLFIIYALLKKPKQFEALKKELKKRNLA